VRPGVFRMAFPRRSRCDSHRALGSNTGDVRSAPGEGDSTGACTAARVPSHTEPPLNLHSCPDLARGWAETAQRTDTTSGLIRPAILGRVCNPRDSFAEVCRQEERMCGQGGQSSPSASPVLWKLTRSFIQLLAALSTMLVLTTSTAAATTITFETIARHTLIRDQFLSLGVRVIGDGGFSGLVYAEGEWGVENFGNSHYMVMDIGQREEPTTIQFVSPTSPYAIVGATSLSMLLGDGDPDLETFRVTYFDRAGALLGAPVEYTTAIDGLLVSATSDSLGSLIGSVELRVLAGSPSGAVMDDLNYSLAAQPVPDPGSTLLLLGMGLAGLRACRKRHG
jgi:hypothetical protein